MKTSINGGLPGGSNRRTESDLPDDIRLGEITSLYPLDTHTINEAANLAGPGVSVITSMH